MQGVTQVHSIIKYYYQPNNLSAEDYVRSRAKLLIATSFTLTIQEGVQWTPEVQLCCCSIGSFLQMHRAGTGRIKV